MRVSHGCIRLYPEDIEYLFNNVKLGTPVNIVNQPYKVGERDGIVYLEADWTRGDATIAAELERFGRSGVPLYLYYPASGNGPIILPQLLTPGILLDAFRRAES